MRVHLFPSRTQKLSSFAPTILGGRLPGKIGNANTITAHESVRFLFCSNINSAYDSPPDCHYGRTILGLPGKIGNANTKLHLKKWNFFNGDGVYGCGIEVRGCLVAYQGDLFLWLHVECAWIPIWNAPELLLRAYRR